MDLKLDVDTDDLAIENGDLVLTTGLDDTRQVLQQTLRAIRGDWFLDLNDGLPYFDQVLVKNPNAPTVAALFKDAITSVATVEELTFFIMELDERTRELTITFRVRASTGEEIEMSDFLVGRVRGKV